MDRLADTDCDKTRPRSHEGLRAALHPNCVVCSPNKIGGLGLQFAPGDDDTVQAEFELDETVEGYAGWPHGGITTSILDGAMTNWLFAHDLTCVTAELKVRFRHPVLLDQPARVTASLETATHPLYVLEAHIVQNSQLKAKATGRFMYARDLMGGL